MEFITSPNYTLLKLTGKKVILPIFLANIHNITSIVFQLQKSDKYTEIKQELIQLDFEYKLYTITTFLNNISDEKYECGIIHCHLSGIQNTLEEIEKEFNILNNEYNYISTSWYYYVIGWVHFNSAVNINNIKRLTKILIERYNMLLQILAVV